MTAGEIISQMYAHPEVNQCFRKMKPPSKFNGSRKEFQDELKAETFRVLCERDPCDIVQMYNDNRLRFFIIRIILNLVKQTNNVIHVNYLSRNTYHLLEEISNEMDVVEHSEHRKLGYLEAVKNHRNVLAVEDKDPDTELHTETLAVLDWMRNESSALNYYANLITLYANLGNIRAVADKTGIPAMSVHQAIKRAKEIIKQKLYEH